MFISLLNAVWDLSIRAVITVRCNHPIHRVPLHGSLILRPLPFGELDLVDFLKEQWPVVILVKDLDNDANGGGFDGNAVVGDGYLKK